MAMGRGRSHAARLAHIAGPKGRAVQVRGRDAGSPPRARGPQGDPWACGTWGGRTVGALRGAVAGIISQLESARGKIDRMESNRICNGRKSNVRTSRLKHFVSYPYVTLRSNGGALEALLEASGSEVHYVLPKYKLYLRTSNREGVVPALLVVSRASRPRRSRKTP